MANILYSMEKKLPKINTKITSKPLNVERKLKTELSFWNGKKETSSGAYDRLKRYWDNTRLREWTATGTPWSAAFISYLVRDNDFKGQASHYKYTKDVMESKNPGWKAFSIPKNKNKIKVQVGDILVKPRSTGTYSTHGDIVGSIRLNKAVLYGGNLGNTAKKSGTIKLNRDGTISDAKGYIILLKKNPVRDIDFGWSKILAYGGFAAAGLLSVTLGWVVFNRKKTENLLEDKNE